LAHKVFVCFVILDELKDVEGAGTLGLVVDAPGLPTR